MTTSSSLSSSSTVIAGRLLWGVVEGGVEGCGGVRKFGDGGAGLWVRGAGCGLVRGIGCGWPSSEDPEISEILNLKSH